MPPVSLSDEELAAVMTACAPLAPDGRGAFLEALASTLAACPVIGPGAVHRAIVDAQRQHFDPPVSDRHAVAVRSKYR
jgi:hypothetical protein